MKNGIDGSHFGFIDDEDIWYLNLQQGDIDVYVAGDQDGPDSDRIQLTDLVMENLQELEQRAVKYLLAFVDQHKLEIKTLWVVTTIECGRHPSTPKNELTLGMMLEGDPYGYWSVSFRYFIDDKVKFHPFAFSRREI